jgi:hypothetical protein
MLISGALLNLSLGLSAEMEMAVPFNFSLLVKQTIILPSHRSGIVPSRTSGVVHLNSSVATTADGYKPFSMGIPALDSATVKSIGTPSTVRTITPVTAPPETKRIPTLIEDAKASDIMAQTAVPKLPTPEPDMVIY